MNILFLLCRERRGSRAVEVRKEKKKSEITSQITVHVELPLDLTSLDEHDFRRTSITPKPSLSLIDDPINKSNNSLKRMCYFLD
jgi:hypothetical protein